MRFTLAPQSPQDYKYLMQSERKQNRPEMTTERETIWEVLTFKICLLILVAISAGEGGEKHNPSGVCFCLTKATLDGILK